jgi:hypothetical protein
MNAEIFLVHMYLELLSPMKEHFKIISFQIIFQGTENMLNSH